MKNSILTKLSKAMNSYLSLDEESKERLHRLKGKTVIIEFLPFHLQFECSFDEQGIILNEISTDSIPVEDVINTTIIRGTPIQLVGVMMAKDNRQRFFAEDVTIEGNAEVGQQVIKLFDELQIDWEEQLSHFIGDVPAHHLNRMMNELKGWFNNTNQSFIQNINEYVHEEMNWFPTRLALQDLFNDIDDVRMQTDRLEARFNKLKSALRNKEDNL